MSKKIVSLLWAMVAAGSALAAFEHAFFETFSLDGEWEMAYRP